MSSSAKLAVVLFLMMVSNNYKACGEGCSSICGGHNVSHPFRLKQYAKECGDRRYELSCEDNQLILNLESAKFSVESIDYSNYTIRVRDANIVDSNFSSLPSSSLTYHDFRYYDPYSTTAISNAIMVYFSCKHAVNSSQYVNATPCMEMEGRNIGSEAGWWLWYVYSNNDGIASLRELGLEEGCSIELIYMTSWPAFDLNHNYSCTDIHNMLLYGFDLSWFNSFCPPKSGNQYYYAYLDHNNKLGCVIYSSSKFTLAG